MSKQTQSTSQNEIDDPAQSSSDDGGKNDKSLQKPSVQPNPDMITQTD